MEPVTFELNACGWIEELRAIQEDIPDFAPWRIPDLIDTFLRYHDLLISLANHPDYRDGCANLLRHSGFIQKCILDTRNPNPYAPFIRAAYELHKDIEQLRAVIREASLLPADTEPAAQPA